jgi:predicted phage-related endonuclease
MFNELAIESLEGKAQRKELNSIIDGAENKIRQLIGEDEGLETGQYKATWKSQAKTSVDTKKMKEDGIYDKYAVRGRTRVLRVAQKKMKEVTND